MREVSFINYHTQTSLRNLPQNQIVLKFLKRVVSGPFKKAVLKLGEGNYFPWSPSSASRASCSP